MLSERSSSCGLENDPGKEAMGEGVVPINADPGAAPGREARGRDGGEQLSFLPEGWVHIDLRENRLSIFLRSYPFEEYFGEIQKEFALRRYQERKAEGLNRQRRRHQEAAHFEFAEEGEVLGRIPVGERRSAAGRKPFDFFATLKLFFACMMKSIVQVTEVHQELHDNPVLQLECFPEGRLPSYDVLAAFDRDMNRFGLMREVRTVAVEANLAAGINEFDGRVIVDVTHSEGNGKVGKVAKRNGDGEAAEPAVRSGSQEGAEEVSVSRDVSAGTSLPGENEVKGRNAQGDGNESERSGDSRAPEGAGSAAALTDETLGIVHKNKGKVLKAHKYQISGTSVELPIGITAFPGSHSDGGESFAQHLQELKDECGTWFKPTEIYADGIYNTAENRQLVTRLFGAETRLMSKPNPGNRKDRKVIRNGVEFTIDKHANVSCERGHKLVFDAREVDQERYRFVIEKEEHCLACPLRLTCCPAAAHGKTLRFSKELLPHYNWEQPEFTVSYEQKYNLRTAIERIIGRGKDLLGFRRQFKRGRSNVQGFGDRLVAMMNMIAYVAHAIGHPERKLQCRNFAAG